MEHVAASTAKHVFILLFDIKQAFDKGVVAGPVSSPRSGPPPTRNPRSDREFPQGPQRVVARLRTGLRHRGHDGMPTGVRARPISMNAVVHQLLERLERADLHPLAFVDDLGVVLEGLTKEEIEEHGRQAVAIVVEWCALVKLQVASQKTKICRLKGHLSKRSPLVIQLDGTTICRNSAPTYLGVVLAKGFNPRAHIAQAGAKALAKFGQTTALSSVTWGISFWSRQILYGALFDSVMVYACPAWTANARSLHWGETNKAQRRALLMVTQAYLTTSTEALQVLAGKLPMDLRLRAVAAKLLLKHDRDPRIQGLTTDKEIDEWSLDEWQAMDVQQQGPPYARDLAGRARPPETKVGRRGPPHLPVGYWSQGLSGKTARFPPAAESSLPVRSQGGDSGACGTGVPPPQRRAPTMARRPGGEQHWKIEHLADGLLVSRKRRGHQKVCARDDDNEAVADQESRAR